MEAVELREGGLLLRPWRPDDAEAVYQACQDPLIPRWTTVPSPYLREHAEDFVGTVSPQEWTQGSGAAFGVFDAATGQLLGANGLVSLDLDAKVAEVGFWVAPWARGRRVATEATRAVARWALTTLGVQRLVWRAEVGNHASRLVAARVGFGFEGIARAALRHGDRRLDGWIGSLLPGELREVAEDDPVLARAAARSRVFGGPQPTLSTTTAEGARVRLRPLRIEDAPACLAAATDPQTVRYTVVPHPYTSHDAESYITAHAPRRWAEGSAGIFAIADADDTFVGSMVLSLAGDGLTTDVGDVGYMVGPWSRGKGYASAALRAVSDWGFAELGLRRIEWRAYVGNTGSQTVAWRAGFTVEGTTRRGLNHRGVYEDAPG